MSLKSRSILLELLNECIAQNKKWGQQNHSPVEWIAILAEEVGGASKEAVDYHFFNPVKLKDGSVGTPSSKDQEDRLSRYRKELIQTAAVAVQMIESLDRNELPKYIEDDGDRLCSGSI